MNLGTEHLAVEMPPDYAIGHFCQATPDRNRCCPSTWVYDGEKPVLGPAPLSDLGWLGSPVHAALDWGPEKNEIYFFRGWDYWRFHPNTRWCVASPMLRWATDCRGVPSETDAAFQDADSYAYFLHGRLYWKFDPVKVKALEGFPRLVGLDFFDCSEPANTFH